MRERLFVYGTLRPGRAPREIADAVDTLQRIGEGTIRGRLYDLGAYPGVILDDAAPEVPGEVFVVTDQRILDRLDIYEGFFPRDPAASLFLRVNAEVTFTGGEREFCWVYVYNRQLPPDYA
jgi:gamma-glutamylcyclotransferase (GGCT)/AIG2-like uncharacterized protein YtfP